MKGNHQNEDITSDGGRTKQTLRTSEFNYHRLFPAAKERILILEAVPPTQ